MVDESKCPACGKREVRPRYIAPTPSSSRRPVLPAIAQLWGCPIYFHHLPPVLLEEPLLTIPSKTHRLPPLRRQIKHEEDLGCDICAACGHVVNERGLTSQVQWTEDAGAMGTYVHEDRGGQLAAARGGLSIGVSGVGAHIAKQFFRDEEATHMENITKSVNFACGQLRLSKDAAADAKALVVKACDGRWGDGEWTTMLTGACVYAASRQNQLPITVRDVAEACQLDVFALGRVYNRLKFLHELKVPPLDPGKFVARAAAAIPELREAIDASSAGADNDETGPSAPAPVRRSRLNVERPGGVNNADKPTPAVDRGAKLAPVIEDARRLLTFADTRGLMTGRGPFPMVAAALGLAAQCRGIALEPAALAKGARASESSTKRASASLRRELSEFARSYAWGEGANSKGIDTFLPLVLGVPRGCHRAEGLRQVGSHAGELQGGGVGAKGSAGEDRRVQGDRLAVGRRRLRWRRRRCFGHERRMDPGSMLAVAKPPRSAKRTNLPNRGGLKPRRRRKRTGGFGGFSGVDDEDEGSRLAIAPPKPPEAAAARGCEASRGNRERGPEAERATQRLERRPDSAVAPRGCPGTARR